MGPLSVAVIARAMGRAHILIVGGTARVEVIYRALRVVCMLCGAFTGAVYGLEMSAISPPLLSIMQLTPEMQCLPSIV